MNFESLRMFCHVVEEGSISGAARASFVSQPAVTRRIHQLENRYGTLLFDRSEGKLMLTEAGKILYPYAKEILEYEKKSVEAIEEMLGTRETVLRVGASLTIGEYLLPGLLGNLKNRYPDLQFSLSIGNTPFILTKLEENEIDCIALVESLVEDTALNFQKFADDELVLVTSELHRWKDRAEVSINELTEEKMIWREKDSGTRLLVEKELNKLGILNQIENAMELGSMQSIKSAVEAELGISILPRLTVVKELKYGTLREVKIKDFILIRDLWIVQKNQRFKKAAQVNFEAFILR